MKPIILNIFSFVLLAAASFCFSCNNNSQKKIPATDTVHHISIKYPLPKSADSLFSLLKIVPEDTNKVNVLNALGWRFMYQNPDTSIVLAMQALSLSENEKSSVGEDIHKKLTANSYHLIASANYLKGDYPSSIENNLKALKLREELGDSAGISKSLGNIGNVYWRESDYAKALDYDFKALKIAEELGNKNGTAADLGNIGTIYNEQADYPKALDYDLKALKMAEELGDKKGIAIDLGNIGNVYYEQANYSQALDYDFKALKMHEELGNKNGIAHAIGNIGIVYYEQADNIKALDYDFKALKMSEELGDKNGIAIDLGNIGIIYAEQADYPKALDYYFKVLKMGEELGDKNLIAGILGNIGSLYIKTGKFVEAEKYLKHSLALADSIKALEYTGGFEKALSELYDTTGRVELAFAHYKKYIAARDSIANDKNTKKQTRIAMQFEFDKKSTADSIRNAEQNKQEVLKHNHEIQQQKIYTYGGAIGFALMLVVAGVSFRAYRNKRKANEIISHQKKLVEEKQKEILDSIHYAKRIQQSMMPTEKYITKSLKNLNSEK